MYTLYYTCVYRQLGVDVGYEDNLYSTFNAL